MLKNHWAELFNPNDSLANIRKKSWDRFEEIGLPRPKQEAFQYFPLQKLIFPKPALEKKGCKESNLVFIDGFFDAERSSIPAPIVCQPLDLAIRSYGLFLQARISRTLKLEKDPFAALNGAFLGRGAFLYIPPKCQVEVALQMLQIFTGDGMATPRLMLYLGRGAKLHLVQSKSGDGFCNAVIDSVLDEGAELTFCDEGSSHFQAFRSTLKRDSKLKAHFFPTGSWCRHSIHIELAEENAEAEIFGLAQLAGEAQAHVHATIEHAAPHTRSRQHFKNVLKEKSRASFEGKIYVCSQAQKTEAYQLNNTLLLSDEAEAKAKPNLEIFADDVKASHGATVGQLDEEQLFYLRSRGLSLENAREWLINGFCKEILDQVTHAPR